MDLTTNSIYRQNPIRIVAMSLLTDPSEKTCFIIFVRTAFWSHQQSHLQRYIRFRPVATLGPHRIPTLGIQMSFYGYDTMMISSI